MKKLTSFILVVVMILSAVSVTAFAQTSESKYLYKDRLVKYYNLDSNNDDIALVNYKEIYYHHVDENDPDSEIDWVLIYAYTNTYAESTCYMLSDSKVKSQSNMAYPFTFYYGVYDVKEDKFFGINGYGDYPDYEGLGEYVQENIGRWIGDADSDGDLTVMDATYIQRVMAQLCEFFSSDTLYYCPLKYLSDYDRDGERTILDATAIQKKLAQVE